MSRKMNIKEIAIDYNQRFGMNVIPIIGKKAIDGWEVWKNNYQSTDDLKTLKWNNAITGFAAICGINYLLCLDLDKVKDKRILIRILEYLGLSIDYEWIVRTKTGFHIWIRVKDINRLFEWMGKGFAFRKYYPKESDTLKQLELRIKSCYVILPPSEHKDGGVYTFLNSEPKEKPVEIEAVNIFCVIKDLFNITDRKKIIERKDNRKPDIKYLTGAIKQLKEYRIGYEIWRDCCFALCSLGDEGLKYFIELSTNDFYPDDTLTDIETQFYECLTRYKTEGIRLNTLFFHAKELGFKYGSKRESLSKVMFTYPLFVLQYNNDCLVEKIISYGIVKQREECLDEKNEKESICPVEIKKFLDAHKINFITAEKVINNYKEIEINRIEFEKVNETDCYGLVGLDFLIECRNGKHRYEWLRSYCAVKAILGRTIRMKWIAYSRIQYAYLGFKSKLVFNIFGNDNVLPSKKTLCRYLKKLKDRKFLAMFYYGRRTYFSTYYNQDVLREKVKQKVLKKDQKKKENSDTRFRKEIKAEREKLKLKRMELHSV